MELQVCTYKVLGIELGIVKIGEKFYCTGKQLATLFGKASEDTIRKALTSPQ